MSQTQTYPTQDKPQSQSEAPKKKKPTQQFKHHVTDSSELAYGQSVIVIARWILVITGLFLILWNPDPISNLRIQVITVLVLALMNFYLQAQILTGKKTFTPVIYTASVVDFIVITLLVLLSGGFDSNTYIFYFPAIMAISVAFETAITIGFVGSAAGIYGVICLGSGAITDDNLPALIARILMMAAIAFCGSLYWHIEHNRRLTAETAHEQLLAEVQRRQPHQTNIAPSEDDHAHTKQS